MVNTFEGGVKLRCSAGLKATFIDAAMFGILMSGLSEEYFLFEDVDDSRIAGEERSRWRTSVVEGEGVRMSAEAMLPA